MSKNIILLVEDNPDDEELTLMAFKQSHISNQVVVVHDGVEALDYLFGRGKFIGSIELPRLVLLDLKLPKIDGREVLRSMRADPRTQVIPVVILTTSSEEEDILTSYRLGANSYVRKPVEFMAFSEAIQHLGLYWLVINQPPPIK